MLWPGKLYHYQLSGCVQTVLVYISASVYIDLLKFLPTRELLQSQRNIETTMDWFLT